MGAGSIDISYFDTIEHSLKRADWKFTFAVLPHRSVRTNKLIWGKTAMRGARIITGPGTPIVEHY